MTMECVMIMKDVIVILITMVPIVLFLWVRFTFLSLIYELILIS